MYYISLLHINTVKGSYTNMLPFWLLGVPTRMKTIDEGRQLAKQLENAKQAATAMRGTLQQSMQEKELADAIYKTAKQAKPNLLLPGAAAVGGGLLAAKGINDLVIKPKTAAKPAYMTEAIYSFNDSNTANFILGTLGMLENTGATLIHGVKNARKKKVLQSITNEANIMAGQIAANKSHVENARAAAEVAMQQANKNAPAKIAAIGLGTTALATPALMYLDNKYNRPI